jgi:hypothetical protein
MDLPLYIPHSRPLHNVLEIHPSRPRTLLNHSHPSRHHQIHIPHILHLRGQLSRRQVPNKHPHLPQSHSRNTYRHPMETSYFHSRNTLTLIRIILRTIHHRPIHIRSDAKHSKHIRPPIHPPTPLRSLLIPIRQYVANPPDDSVYPKHFPHSVTSTQTMPSNPPPSRTNEPKIDSHIDTYPD